MPELTGDFETGKLPKIAPGSVTIAISRTIQPGTRADFEQWCNDMLHEVQKAEGCLGAAVLMPAKKSDPYQMVFRFIDAVHLRRWERSEIRQELREKANQYIVTEKVTVTAGTEEFFNALTDVDKPRSKTVRFVSDVAWVYPIALLSAIYISPLLAKVELIPRVFISTVIIGVTSKYATAPIRRWWRRRRMLPQGAPLRDL